MKLFRCILLPVLSGLALSSSLFAYDFSKADSLFAGRSGGFEAASKARDEYGKALKKNLSEKEKEYAVTQMSRLDIYRGGMLSGVDNATAKDIFEDCLDTVEQIEGSKSQTYYYYHVACLAFRGKVASPLGRLKWALKLKNIQDAALYSTKEGDSVEGGGLHRVISAIRGNRKAKRLGDLYNPAEALEFAKLALQTPKTDVKPYPNPLSGRDYHENYYFLAQAQIAVALEEDTKSMAQKGLSTLVSTVENLDLLEEIDELPKGREPETVYYKEKMISLQGVLSSCLAEGSSWKACLIEKMD